MATFGTTDGTSLTTGGLDQIIGITYTLAETGTITRLNVWSPNNGFFIGAIYSDVAGTPTTLLVKNEVPASVSAGAFSPIDLPATTLLAGTYWLTAMCSASNMRAWRAGPGGNKVAYNLSTLYASGVFPSTFPAVTFSTEDYPIYATYTNLTTNKIPAEAGERISAYPSGISSVGALH